MKLIDNWRQLWRAWSLRLAAAWSVLFGALVANPDLLNSVWASLPGETKDLFSPLVRGVISGLAMLASIWLARSVKQEALAASPKDDQP